MSFFKRLFSFNSSRFRLLKEVASFAKSVPHGALILDAGSGDAPYKSLFRHAKYESADFEKLNKPYGKTTYVCDLKSIPVKEGRFDFIIFNQVLEHIPEPKLVLHELNRVLKQGGEMLYTGPLFYEEHEQPYDFYRYTQFGLRYLFNATGFEIVRLDWLEGYFGTIGYQLSCMTQYIPFKPSKLKIGRKGYILVPFLGLLKISMAILSIFFHRLETQIKYVGAGHPKNYIAILKKI